MTTTRTSASPATSRTAIDWRTVWRNWSKALVYVGGMTPAAWTFYLALSDQLGADPLRSLERTLGLWALRFLVIGLAITPLRKLAGVNLIRYRRAIGLVAFYNAVAHFTVYAWLDQGLDMTAIWGDIVKRPYITIGMFSFLILIPLAATSTNSMIKRVGAMNWQGLHKWVYLAVPLAALHFIMLVKSWPPEPLLYAFLTTVLLAWRVWDKLTKAPKVRGRGRAAT